MSTAAKGDLGFTYRPRRGGVVQVLHRGQPAATLRGVAGAEFLAAVAASGDREAQQLMARITGNYKRGNERRAASHPRNRR